MEKKCKRCNKVRTHYAKGYCRSCYQAVRSGRKQRQKHEYCLNCGYMFNEITGLKHYAKGLCQKCYGKQRI